jgi:hypothetical protein
MVGQKLAASAASNIQSVQGPRALPASISELSGAVSSLESALYSLKGQLSPVLDIEAYENGCGIEQSIEPEQLCERISRVTSRIRDLNQTANDLISRLHV